MSGRPHASKTRPTDMGDPPQLALRVQVDASPEAAREARNQLRKLLKGTPLSERTANAALDVAHELMINAQQHGRPPVHLVVVVGPVEVRVEVRDASPRPAKVLPYRPGISDRGLGLRLVRHLSVAWGQEFGADGKSVWALIR